jgi:hypothetical protein
MSIFYCWSQTEWLHQQGNVRSKHTNNEMLDQNILTLLVCFDLTFPC